MLATSEPCPVSVIANAPRTSSDMAPASSLAWWSSVPRCRIADPSLQIKAGVQWGLFASAILHLGTEDHHARLLPGAMSLDVLGAFAMTETGHGSDVASIGTTATYDPATEEFVLHTPFRAAWKDYLGNAAQHATAPYLSSRSRRGTRTWSKCSRPLSTPLSPPLRPSSSPPMPGRNSRVRGSRIGR